MGVKVVHTEEQLRDHATTLFKTNSIILVEEFLSGEEITIAVMPPGQFDVRLMRAPRPQTANAIIH